MTKFLKISKIEDDKTRSLLFINTDKILSIQSLYDGCRISMDNSSHIKTDKNYQDLISNLEVVMPNLKRIPCPTCKGKGVVEENVCPTCEGNGFLYREDEKKDQIKESGLFPINS